MRILCESVASITSATVRKVLRVISPLSLPGGQVRSEEANIHNMCCDQRTFNPLVASSNFALPTSFCFELLALSSAIAVGLFAFWGSNSEKSGGRYGRWKLAPMRGSQRGHEAARGGPRCPAWGGPMGGGDGGPEKLPGSSRRSSDGPGPQNFFFQL